jgi:hypothetical protein
MTKEEEEEDASTTATIPRRRWQTRDDNDCGDDNEGKRNGILTRGRMLRQRRQLCETDEPERPLVRLSIVIL